ncbi:hypothetical protein MMC20_000122 [Loxospora ochrophaea]|nr:hypothetical protein [Loxospora ochrophaea]
MTTSIAGDLDAQIVQRSQGLFDSGRYYGERFEFSEFGSTPNSFIGIVTHFALSIGMTALALAPVRWLLKKLIYTPGQGPSRESTSKDYLEHRAVGTADQTTASPGRAIARFRWNGSMYHISGVLLAEAAITILRDSTAAHGLGGGMLTPATLGQSYIDRLKAAGVIFEIEVMD